MCSGGSCVPRTSLDVRRGAIADHGDASVSGSLAAVLTCAGPGDTVRLVDAGAYVTESQIRLPARVTLAGTSGAILRAGRGVMGRALVLVADGVTVRDLALDGGRNAHHLLQGGGVSDVSVLRSHLYDTRNAYPSGSNPRCHGLVLTASTRVTIRDNTIERIGYPKVSGTSWSGVCAGMYLERARTLNVHGNTVRDVLTAGIDFTGTLGAQITGNRIEDNGRNRAYGGPVADGITAYHNGHGFTYQDIWVTGNTILRSGNHGIHLSGRDVHIERNVIRDPWAQGILVMDQYTPHDCASNVTVHDNTISGIGSTGNRHAVYVGDDYKVGGVSVRGNGPDVYWKPGTTCT